MVQQFIHGTQYIDELVMVRVADKGDMYIHQDATWNVIATTDLATNVVERYDYLPYGQFTVLQETSFCDRDGDGEVDSSDKGSPGFICVGTVSGACRVLDLDFDGDYDSGDATLFDALSQGVARHPGRIATATDQPFAHQGLLFEPEIGSYQNRAREYDPKKRKFAQRDPIGPVEGLNLLTYLKSNPIKNVDASDLACTPVGAVISIIIVKIDGCYCGFDDTCKLCKTCTGSVFFTFAQFCSCFGTPTAPCPPVPPWVPLGPVCGMDPQQCHADCISDFCGDLPHGPAQAMCEQGCNEVCEECHD